MPSGTPGRSPGPPARDGAEIVDEAGAVIGIGTDLLGSDGLDLHAELGQLPREGFFQPLARNLDLIEVVGR